MKKGIVVVLFCFVSAMTLAQSVATEGQVLFKQKCVRCHGADGTKGAFGAKNLKRSILTEEQYFQIIANGKGSMPAWKHKLSDAQIKTLVSYLKSLTY